MMNESAELQLHRVVSNLLSSPDRRGADLRAQVRQAVVDEDIARLVAHIAGFNGPRMAGLALDDVWRVLDKSWGLTSVREARCLLHAEQLRRLDRRTASDVVEALGLWAEGIPSRVMGSLFVIFEHDLALARDDDHLNLALRAHKAGWQVLTGSAASPDALVQVDIHTADETMRLVASRDASAREGVSCQVLWPDDTPHAAGASGGWHSVVVPSPPATTQDDRPGEATDDPAERLAVSDLFGDRIVLRDLEPRAAALESLRTLRVELGWDAAFIPRKNEPEYAQALVRIIRPLFPTGPESIVYVGDTLLNDGGAIRGLQAIDAAPAVWGFLCGATSARHTDDFVLDDVYFGALWGSLAGFFAHLRARGTVVGEGMCAFFDLDQTVYAAKRRDDGPLHLARWEAVRNYLRGLVPPYRFDAERAEALYREFDRDSYHPVTRDNMDYIVLLVLAVISGLADAGEIGSYATSSRPSIGALAEELRRRAAVRLGHEEIGPVLDAIKAIHYNTIAGDQTPCKDFRTLECVSMAERMRHDGLDDGERIVLNREVVDVVRFLQQAGAVVLAVSDRPVEAAVVEGDGDQAADGIDLMGIPMTVRGTAIAMALDDGSS